MKSSGKKAPAGVESKALVFLGGGRITSALIAGLRLAGYDEPIIVHDRHPEKLRALQRRYGLITERDRQRAVAKAGLLIIAVRPASVLGLLASIAPIHRPLLAVSLAAGIPLAALRGKIGPQVRWARAMPSPVCRSCKGLTGITFDVGRTLLSAASNKPVNSAPSPPTAADRSAIRKIFALVGDVIEIPEREFDAFTVTYSASHGYHALATLAHAAERLGLNRKTALAAAAHALADGIHAWREGDESLDALIEEAATPGGIAATVMATLDQRGYQKHVVAALHAGMARARKNARKTN